MSRLAPTLAIVGFFLWLTALAGGLTAVAQPTQRFERSELTIETAQGGSYRFTIELALTPAQQAQGLMHRPSLGTDAGMLFLFDPVRPVSFWMHNTLIPLDMVFIAPDGRIVRIAARTTPLSDEPVPSGAPVRAVLEINGGLAAVLGIAPGDRVVYPAFN